MPILKSFVINVQYLSDKQRINTIMEQYKCDYDKATKLDWEINCRDIESNFLFETRTVLALYTKLFPKYKTNNCKGIVIDCVKEINDNRIFNFEGIYRIQVVFDILQYNKLGEFEKKQSILSLLKDGLDIIIDEEQWDREVFDETHRKVIEANFINEWYWKKAVKSPTKEYSAIVFCEHKLKEFDISIIISNKKGEEIKRKLILVEKPDELVFKINLGKLKWASEDEVALFNIFGNKHWSVKLD